MLNLGYSTKASSLCEYSLINWEENIKDVALEPCDAKEDPFGYLVVFYNDCGDASDSGEDMSVSYVIGASLLRSRLRKLNRAGFAAPMTQKAIKMIEQNNRAVLTH